jgi:protein SCO1/2
MIVPGKPTILAIVYYRCPTMCNLVLNGMVSTLKEINFVPGEDYNVLAVSFDPEETHVTAAEKKSNYLKDFGNRDAEGWTFAVGAEPQIEQLTRAVGFGYKYDAMDDQYSHGSGLLILTPDGRISRFLPGLMYPVLDTRLALVEAAEGKIGTLSDKLALLCYSYDPETGKYGLLVNRIILVACLVTIAAVAWMIIALLKIDRRRTREALAETTS